MSSHGSPFFGSYSPLSSQRSSPSTSYSSSSLSRSPSLSFKSSSSLSSLRNPYQRGNITRDSFITRSLGSLSSLSGSPNTYDQYRSPVVNSPRHYSAKSKDFKSGSKMRPAYSSGNLTSLSDNALNYYTTPSAASIASPESSTSSLSYRSRSSSRSSTKDESSEKDWKKMYEELLFEFENYKKEHQKKEQEWGREKRSLQRKVSELEEEVKQMEPHKSENQKLKDENAALIRVISKLSK